ncbi:MAG: hypothetical protein KDI07_20080 [Anaerolineae bacterium]|nr:hypothetical protein [Anaerolineae bacterium]MCB9131510.1 hypothetical protein [Anaerolineales bacterium]
MDISENNLSSDALRDDVAAALSQWSKGGAASPLGYLRLVHKARQETGAGEVRAANQVLLMGVDALERESAEQAKLLRWRYLDGLTMLHVANRLNRSEPACYRLQRQAIERLAEILLASEQQLRDTQAALAVEKLGVPPYESLFGVDSFVDRLLDMLAVAEAPWLVLLEGIGGIGKTSLADALLRRAIGAGAFAGFGWVTARRQILRLSGAMKTVATPTLTTDELIECLAKQLMPDTPLPLPFRVDTTLPLLRGRLNARPHLIVVDNLETVIDLETLLPTLRLLAKPSKFVLTSRSSLQDEASIYHFPVPELSQHHAMQLLRHEARSRNAHLLAAASDEDLRSITATVGGNPLALRLVVGQTLIHDLPAILDSLRAARGQAIQQLYSYIYRQAWEGLNETAQRALLAMPLMPPPGRDAAFLSRVSGLALSDVQNALSMLVNLNLVDRGGDLQSSCYSIHPLTRTFLLEQVAKWH